MYIFLCLRVEYMFLFLFMLFLSGCFEANFSYKYTDLKDTFLKDLFFLDPQQNWEGIVEISHTPHPHHMYVTS